MKGTIVLAGGGTAGHVNPLLATADALSKLCDNPRLVLGTASGLESTLVPLAGEELLTIERIPMPRRPSLDLVRLPVRLRRTITQLRNEFVKREVAVVVGFGGYVCPPAYLAARSLGIPVVLHEQNARPGIANRLGARFAAVVALTFANTVLRARKGQTVVTGMPLRAEIMALASKMRDKNKREECKKEAGEIFNLDWQKPVVLITGGSLGALRLNEVLPEAVAALDSEVQVIHIAGKGKDEPVRQAVTRLGLQDRYRVLDYCSQMQQALAASDLVICRCGAGTVSELQALGLPAIFVPLPVGNGEQALNAKTLVDSGAALLVHDKDLAKVGVEKLISQCLEPAMQAKMRPGGADLSNGAMLLAKLIVQTMEKTNV